MPATSKVIRKASIYARPRRGSNTASIPWKDLNAMKGPTGYGQHILSLILDGHLAHSRAGPGRYGCLRQIPAGARHADQVAHPDPEPGTGSRYRHPVHPAQFEYRSESFAPLRQLRQGAGRGQMVVLLTAARISGDGDDNRQPNWKKGEIAESLIQRRPGEYHCSHLHENRDSQEGCRGLLNADPASPRYRPAKNRLIRENTDMALVS